LLSLSGWLAAIVSAPANSTKGEKDSISFQKAEKRFPIGGSMLFQIGRWFSSIAVLGCFVFPPCAASQDAVPPTNEATPPTQQLARVVLLTPLLRFEDTGSGGSTIISNGIVSLPGFPGNFRREKVLTKLAARDADFESRLLSAAKTALGSMATIMLPEGRSQPEAFARLNEVSSRLARGNVTDEAKTDLNLLSAPGERQLVLAHFLKIKVGPGRSWDPNLGTITSAMESTLAQAALVCSDTGKVVWKNEQFIRKALQPDSSEFSKMLTHLYDGLEIKPGGVQCE
jgi:hypothetical protein